MPVVLLITIVIVLTVAVLVAQGRGGELPAERTDHAPLELGPVTATDVVLLRPPTALWGYNVQATDEAMMQIAESIRERDVRIVALEQLVTDLSREHPPAPLSSPYVGTRRRQSEAPGLDTQGDSDSPGTVETPASENPGTSGTPASESPETPETPETPGAPGSPGKGASGTPDDAGTTGTPGPPPEQSHD